MHRHGMTVYTVGATCTVLEWSHGCRYRNRGKEDQMGQLRKLKRQFERDSRKKTMKELYEHCDRVSEQQERELRQQYKKAANDQDVKNMVYAMYYLFGVHLHDEFGFGGKRLLRLFESVDREIATWASGGITTGQLQQKLFDTTGIDLRLDGIDFRKETA